jgi:hypothetical protein
MTRSGSGPSSVPPLAVASLVAAAAAVLSYVITKRIEEEKYRKLLFGQYQDEKRSKEATAIERKAAKLPVGVETEDVQILKVFVWVCEDLKRRFESANVENLMVNKASKGRSRSQSLRHRRNGSGDLIFGEDNTQPYNKIIDDKQVILSEIVRKPSMPPHTVGYMRAGTNLVCFCAIGRSKGFVAFYLHILLLLAFRTAQAVAL